MSQLGTLYQYEIKKLLKRKMTWIAFIGVMLVMSLYCFSGLLDNYCLSNPQTGEKVYYSQYDLVRQDADAAEHLNGRILDDLLLQEMQAAYAGVHTREYTLQREAADTENSVEMITSEIPEDRAEAERLSEQRRQYKEIYEYVRETVGDEKVHTVDAAGFYRERERKAADYELLLHLTEGEKEYWRQREAQPPFRYDWVYGPEMMLASFKLILILTALMIGMVFSGVFADEHMRKTDQLVLCSRHGRSTVYLAKLLAASSLGSAGTLLVGGFTMLSLGLLYGYETGWNAPLQIYLPLSPFALSMGQTIVILAVLLLLSAVLHSVLTLALSGWTKSSVASMSLMVVYTLGTQVVNIPERLRLLSQTLYLTPAKLVRASAFYDMRLTGANGHYLTNWQTGMLLYVLLALLLALLGRQICRRWQISGR